MAFPTTSLIDSFTRANQDPVASGWLGPTRLAANSGQCKVLSNALVASTIVGGTTHSYWNTSFAANQEAWITVTTLPAAAGGVSVTARINSPNSAACDYYQWTYTVGTGWRMFRVVNDAYTQIGSTVVTPTLAAGEKIGYELLGTQLRGLHFTGGVWNQIMLVTDTVITDVGFIGAEITDSTAVADDFGGGSSGSLATDTPFTLLGRGATW